MIGKSHKNYTLEKILQKCIKKELNIKVYTSKDCPSCLKLKEFILSENISFEEVDINDKEALVNLRMEGIFPYAPILQVQSRFFTRNELFVSDELDKTKIRSFLSSCR